MIIVLVTGGFDPLHSGHIEYFRAAKELGDHLVVGLNSDQWLTRKKGRPFMPMEERMAFVSELECVDEVIGFDDSDNTACAAISQVLSTKASDWKVLFANGGDKDKENVPEYVVFNSRPDVNFAWGVGGTDKINSSSWLLEKWDKPITDRVWGTYRILDHKDGWKVKELCVKTGKALSDQRHFKRSEHWHVVDGVINMLIEDRNGNKSSHLLVPGDSIDIPIGCWHKAINVDNIDAKVIEVWLGRQLTESDIERRD